MDQNQYFDMDSYRSGNQSAQLVKNKDKGAFLGGLVLGMIGTLAITCLIILAYWNAGKATAQRNGGGSGGNVGISATEKKTGNENFVTDAMISKINYLADLVHKGYFLSEVSDEDLENGLYKGLIDSLGDPYSEYYTAKEYEDVMQGATGVYSGIGAYVSIDANTNLPKIAGVFKKGPAEEAGLRTDDLIYMVDGVLTTGKSLTEVVSEIRGEENSKVNITIVRDSEQLDVVVTRRKVENPTVETKMLENGMGYLQITEFDDVTTGQFLEGMESLYQSGMQGLILDLRANPGGNVSTVVQIAQNLLPEGLIVYAEDKNGNRRDYKCKGDKKIQIPLVVLVDSNSASASEILAGAIQDYKIGTLVGKKTFGKGIIQSVIPSADGTAVRITTSGYFTPNGRNIHKIGIEPDIECDFDGSLYYDVENPVDTQLEKGKEVLADLMGK